MTSPEKDRNTVHLSLTHQDIKPVYSIAETERDIHSGGTRTSD